jgi:uridylate kinase
MPHVSENFSHKKVAHHFKQGRIVIFAGGLGRPFHSTDSAAAQAAAEFNADIILKASTIDGVYDKDPHKFPDAVRYSTLTYDEAIVKNLRIMDQEALAKCRDNHLTVFVFDASNLSRLTEIISGDMRLGTIINSK